MNFLEFMVHDFLKFNVPRFFATLGYLNSLAKAGGGGPYYMIKHYQKHTVLNYSPPSPFLPNISPTCVVGGGGLSFQKPKKYLKKELKTGDIKLPMFLCCKCGGTL
jgi:hypothetical protein